MSEFRRPSTTSSAPRSTTVPRYRASVPTRFTKLAPKAWGAASTAAPTAMRPPAGACFGARGGGAAGAGAGAAASPSSPSRDAERARSRSVFARST